MSAVWEAATRSQSFSVFSVAVLSVDDGGPNRDGRQGAEEIARPVKRGSLTPHTALSGTETRQIGRIGGYNGWPAMCPAVHVTMGSGAPVSSKSLRQRSHAPTGEAHEQGYKPKTPRPKPGQGQRAKVDQIAAAAWHGCNCKHGYDCTAGIPKASQALERTDRLPEYGDTKA